MKKLIVRSCLALFIFASVISCDSFEEKKKVHVYNRAELAQHSFICSIGSTNVRDEPSKNSEIVGKLTPGQRVGFESLPNGNEDWVFIDMNENKYLPDTRGYVYAPLMRPCD